MLSILLCPVRSKSRSPGHIRLCFWREDCRRICRHGLKPSHLLFKAPCDLDDSHITSEPLKLPRDILESPAGPVEPQPVLGFRGVSFVLEIWARPPYFHGMWLHKVPGLPLCVATLRPWLPFPGARFLHLQITRSCLAGTKDGGGAEAEEHLFWAGGCQSSPC